MLRTLIFRFHNLNAMPLAKIRADLLHFVETDRLDSELKDHARRCIDEINQLPSTLPAPKGTSTLRWQPTSSNAKDASADLLKSAKKWLAEREKYREQKT
jgi:hypothetical protein